MPDKYTLSRWKYCVQPVCLACSSCHFVERGNQVYPGRKSVSTIELQDRNSVLPSQPFQLNWLETDWLTVEIIWPVLSSLFNSIESHKNCQWIERERERERNRWGKIENELCISSRIRPLGKPASPSWSFYLFVWLSDDDDHSICGSSGINWFRIKL